MKSGPGCQIRYGTPHSMCISEEQHTRYSLSVSLGWLILGVHFARPVVWSDMSLAVAVTETFKRDSHLSW